MSNWTEPQSASTVLLINGADIEPEVIRWLWPGWLACGKLHIMAGAPGTGKTTIALALAATVTTGGRFPDHSQCQPGNVLIWSGEDDPKDTLMPRLLAMGADRNRIYFVSGMSINGEPEQFDPAKHFSALAEPATEIGGIKLIIVDPIVNAVAGDSHKATEVRRSLQPVVNLATKLDAAIVGISHFSKGTAGNDPLERVTGSNAFGALPRIVMATARVKDDMDASAPSKRILVRAKSNIGPDGGGYCYSLEQSAVQGYAGLSASRVLWGAELEGTAKQLLATAETEGVTEGHSQRELAANWLRNLLMDEPDGLKVRDIIERAENEGFKKRTIYRAKDDLGIMRDSNGFSGDKVSIWSLPIPATNSANFANPEAGKYGGNGGEIEVQ